MGSSSDPQAVAKATRMAVARGVTLLSLLTLILLGGSGDWRWPAGWAYVALLVLSQLAAFRILRHGSPDLLVERSKVQAGTKSWDKLIVGFIAIVCPLASWILAALDHRYGWTPVRPAALVVAGFVAATAGVTLIAWALAVNRFFAATVRIQDDRGHEVVSSGPYALLRHPGYTGMILYALATPLALSSDVTWIAVSLHALALIVRTVLEDRTLQRELDGYRDYAARVRSRLIPYVW
jgi:protein-S-isoprenylcysteine O-methyltransferase Ste14